MMGLVLSGVSRLLSLVKGMGPGGLLIVVLCVEGES